jgi:hypothetical protein
VAKLELSAMKRALPPSAAACIAMMFWSCGDAPIQRNGSLAALADSALPRGHRPVQCRRVDSASLADDRRNVICEGRVGDSIVSVLNRSSDGTVLWVVRTWGDTAGPLLSVDSALSRRLTEQYGPPERVIMHGVDTKGLRWEAAFGHVSLMPTTRGSQQQVLFSVKQPTADQ